MLKANNLNTRIVKTTRIGKIQIRNNSNDVNNSIHTHTIKTPVGIKAAIASLKPKTTRLSIEGPIECDLQGFALLNAPGFNLSLIHI